MGWDSNPRYLAVYLISSQAPSTTRTPIRRLGYYIILTAPCKKFLQNFFTALCFDTGFDDGICMETGVEGNLEEAPTGSGYAVARPKDNASDPGIIDGTGAHGAGFHGHIKGGVS